MAVLMLEISTSSVKVMVVDAQFKVQCEFSEKILFQDGIQDPDPICETAFRLGKQAAASYQSKENGGEIRAVGIVSTWHNSLVIDRAGAPKTPAYTWTYREPGRTAAAFREADPAHALAYYQKTGCIVNGTYVSFRMKYFTEQGFTFKKGDLLIDQGTYLFYLLTGALRESFSMASGTGLFHLRNLAWDADIAAEMGVPLSVLPELCDYDTCAPLQKGAAQRLGLSQGIPVVTAHPDGAMNQVGDDALSPGTMTLSVGTSAALRLVTDRAVLPETPSLWCYYAPGSYLTGAATGGCANCVDWFAKELCGNVFSYGELDRMAAEDLQKADGCDSPVFLPFLFGERSPGWSEYRRGGFLHVKGQHGAGALYRSVLEGICFNIRQCYEILCKYNGAPERIHVSGGIVRSAVWSSMLANVLQRELCLSPVQNASTVGGAKLALYAAGECPDITCRTEAKRSVLSPDPAQADRYGRLYQTYCRCYEETENCQ